MDCNNISLTSDNSVYPAGAAPAQKILSRDLMNKLTPLVSLRDCVAMTRVCRRWKEIIELDKRLISEVMFGKKQWEQIPGVTDVGEEPILTHAQRARLFDRLKELCPFFNKPDPIQAHRFQNKITNGFWETFRVILIPGQINGKDTDINLINTFKKALEYITGDSDSAFRTKTAGRSYFLIVSLDVIPGSRRTSHEKKVSLLDPHQFRVPNPLEAAIMTFVLNLGPSLEGKGFFFGQDGGGWWTYMATDTLFEGGRLVVGAASPVGSWVYDIYDGNGDVGAAAVAEVV